MIEKLCNLTRFDIENGPYFVGSYLTHIVESKFCQPIWSPNDIDIVCRNRMQMYKLKRIFNQTCTFYQEKEILARKCFESLGFDTLSMSWVIEGKYITATIEDISGKGHSENVADITIASFTSDGVNHFSPPKAIEDVKNKFIVPNGLPNIIDVFNKNFSNENIYMTKTQFYTHLMERHVKYIRRGYKNIDNSYVNVIRNHIGVM